MGKKNYIKPKNVEEFYKLVSKNRGIEQTWLSTFITVYENATDEMLELICTTKPFGIKTSLSIVELGKKKQKKFLKWYNLKKKALDVGSGKIVFSKYTAKEVHLWVSSKKKKEK